MGSFNQSYHDLALILASWVKHGLRVNVMIIGSIVMFNLSKCCPSIMAVATCARHKCVT